MTTELTPSWTIRSVTRREFGVRAPDWAYALTGASPESTVEEDDQRERVVAGDGWAVLSISAVCPDEMTASELEKLACGLYLELLERAAGLATPHLVRVWNFIPRILHPLSDLPHTYMAFNAGRFRAYSKWFGGGFPRHMPTASGVGHPCNRLTIHTLASSRPGVPIDNPRQRPPHRYSPRYGRFPPCFTRAVQIERPDSSRWLLAGGTASVRGEDTVHPTGLEAQIGETLVNLAALIAEATPSTAANGKPTQDPIGERLDRYRQIRVYLPPATSAEHVAARLRADFRFVEELEVVPTELCRPDLLIEIEGAAELGPASNGT